MNNILLTGQCSLHWGRLEFGNLGSYAVIDPLFKELRKTFPDYEISTTFQMTDQYCELEKIRKLPMELYYGWKKSDFLKSCYEFLISAIMRNRIPTIFQTRFISEVLKSDLVIDFSGDMWGDNADLAGKHRFIIGLFKDLTSYFLGKTTVMIAGSPGPFLGFLKKLMAKYVFSKFKLITNREDISTKLLQKDNFKMDNVHSLACPAFLFKAKPELHMVETFRKENLRDNSQNKVGFIICGWNMSKGPFGLWPRDDSEYEVFAETVEYISNTLNSKVYLLSHNNGFIPPPNFRITEGRDHMLLRQLRDILNKRGKTDRYTTLSDIYNTSETKAIIGKFDMLVTGRIHAAVSGLTQFVPTVIIDYGHEPKAHKLKGFADLAGISEYIADPSDKNDMISKVQMCWENRDQIREQLKINIPLVQYKARKNFHMLKDLMEAKTQL